MKLMTRRDGKVFNKFTTATQESALDRYFIPYLLGNPFVTFTIVPSRAQWLHAGHRVISSITENRARQRSNERFTACHRVAAFKAKSAVGRIEFHTIRHRRVLTRGRSEIVFLPRTCCRPRRRPRKGEK